MTSKRYSYDNNNNTDEFELQQASYHMAPRCLYSKFIALGRFVRSCDKLASTLVAM